MGLARRLFGISILETQVSRRGFRVADAAVRLRLEAIGAAFVEGYHHALDRDLPALNQVPLELRGFAYEGAAMGLFLLDHVLPGRRFQAFLAGPGAPHIYMAHVGAGWAIARLPWLRRRLDAALSSMDPLLRWLAVDGYGFHEGYFHWPTRITEQGIPAGLRGYARNAFDQGLGRSLWFVEGAASHRIAATINLFPESRRPDLWSGIGLAAAYAGGCSETALQFVVKASGPYRASFAQGAAFAAQARLRAQNLTPHTGLACQLICGSSASEAAAVTESARTGATSYEDWRGRIRRAFAAQGASA